MFKDIKISIKLMIITSVVFVAASISYYTVFSYLYKENMRHDIVDHMARIETAMQDLEKEDTKALSTAMEVLLRDRQLKEIYLSKDRERLYEFGQPLFKELKEKYGITHFYFHLPAGINFLRLHDKGLYGDEIKRTTFTKARDSKGFAGGIELGKTAFALRVVAPYYDKGELIGYLELGEEIEHFLNVLKGGRGNEFAIIADKEYLSREDWASVRREAGLKDNWDDSKEHLWITKTSEDQKIKGCFTEEKVNILEAGKKYISDFAGLKQDFVCGGFPIQDASGRHVGLVLTYLDISEHIAMVKMTKVYVIGIFIALSILAFIAINLLVRMLIANPIEKLSRAAEVMAGGNLAHRLEVRSRDEIGLLGQAVNDMAFRLEGIYNNMETQVAERTQELQAANEEMAATNEEMIATNEELQATYSQSEVLAAELEEINESYAKANEELKSLEKLKTNFLQTISHELRSPLTPILGYLEMLRDGDIGEFSSKQREIFDEMHLCGKNMQIVVDELVEVASIQAGKLSLDFMDVDLNSLLSQTVKQIKRYAEDHHIEIELKLPSAPLMVIGDNHSIAEIFTHLIRNAVKFGRENGKVRIEALAKENGVEVSVKDNGIGISRDKLTRIYDAFYQADSSSARHYEGVGLGLYLVKRLVDIHNGVIEVQSEEGAGSAFTVFIPQNRIGSARIGASHNLSNVSWDI